MERRYKHTLKFKNRQHADEAFGLIHKNYPMLEIHVAHSGSGMTMPQCWFYSSQIVTTEAIWDVSELTDPDDWSFNDENKGEIR
jgi:hypothetical protein